MSYLRVIPRDLFNEADLLKCLGQLWLHLDMLADGSTVLGDADGEHDGAPFDIQQDEGSGALTVANLPFFIGGRPYRLTRPLNARAKWPLYATDEEDGETRVFDEEGNLSPEFAALIA